MYNGRKNIRYYEINSRVFRNLKACGGREGKREKEKDNRERERENERIGEDGSTTNYIEVPPIDRKVRAAIPRLDGLYNWIFSFVISALFSFTFLVKKRQPQ